MLINGRRYLQSRPKLKFKEKFLISLKISRQKKTKKFKEKLMIIFCTV